MIILLLKDILKIKLGPFLKKLHFTWSKIDPIEILCCLLKKHIAPSFWKIVFLCPLLICIVIYFPLYIGAYSSSLSDNTWLHKNKGEKWKQEWEKKKNNMFNKKLVGVGPVDNRPSNNMLHHSVKKKVTFDMWQVTCDTWHVTHDTWQVGGNDLSLKLSAP